MDTLIYHFDDEVTTAVRLHSTDMGHITLVMSVRASFSLSQYNSLKLNNIMILKVLHGFYINK